MEAHVIELLPLATKIAREFSNIPGLPHAEIELAAQEALAHAARLCDPAKGDFTAYASWPNASAMARATPKSEPPSASPNKPPTNSPEPPSPPSARNSKPWASKASTPSAFLKVAVASRSQSSRRLHHPSRTRPRRLRGRLSRHPEIRRHSGGRETHALPRPGGPPRHRPLQTRNAGQSTESRKKVRIRSVQLRC